MEENKKEESKNEETEKENKIHENVIDSDEEKNEKDDKKSKKEKIAYLESQVKYWQNKYYEAYADMDNLRKQIEKDHANVMKYRSQGFLEALLPAFDNFFNCFKFKPTDPNLAAYCKGFEMIYNQMIMALENEGVKEIQPKIGDAFDHHTMQAVDVKDGEKDDIVLQVSNKGYMLKDRLVRPAMVIVSKVKKTEETKETSEKKETEVKEENK